jgi:alpha-beta hydrolase superfamily lysophospholipase
LDPLRVRRFAGDWADFETRAADGTRISGTALTSTAPAGTAEWAIVLAHGLFANRRLPSLLDFAESLTRFGPVWTIDLRGHGSSGGVCTLGEDEALDVLAGVAVARAAPAGAPAPAAEPGPTQPAVASGGRPVVTIGLSMGAAAAIRAAALAERAGKADGVIAISCLAPWRARRGWGFRKTELVWQLPGGRRLARTVTGVALSGSRPPGLSPLEAIPAVAPSPVLIVHGTADPFFRPSEAKALYAAAGEPKGLWLIDGGGHAEGVFSRPGRPVVRAVVDAFAAELIARLEALSRPPGAPPADLAAPADIAAPAAPPEGRPGGAYS